MPISCGYPRDARMKKLIEGTILVGGGLCWIGGALGFGFVLLDYFAQEAGLRIIGLGVSSAGVLLGLVDLVGLFAASGLCFVVGVGLFAHGMVPARELAAERKRRLSFIRPIIAGGPWKVRENPVLRCVRCNVPIGACLHICPGCGWTQPYDHGA